MPCVWREREMSENGYWISGRNLNAIPSAAAAYTFNAEAKSHSWASRTKALIKNEFSSLVTIIYVLDLEATFFTIYSNFQIVFLYFYFPLLPFLSLPLPSNQK